MAQVLSSLLVICHALKAVSTLSLHFGVAARQQIVSSPKPYYLRIKCCGSMPPVCIAVFSLPLHQTLHCLSQCAILQYTSHLHHRKAKALVVGVILHMPSKAL